jgi:hypothetical protein
VVFDNAADLDALARFVPAAGQCQVIITSNQVEAGGLGDPVMVDVFTEAEALAFLARRTGRTDAAGARELSGELGFLPLALAQAAAVIAAQHLDYLAYLARLRAASVHDLLKRPSGEPYPHGAAEAIVLALDAAVAADPGGLCGGAGRRDRPVVGGRGVPGAAVCGRAAGPARPARHPGTCRAGQCR